MKKEVQLIILPTKEKSILYRLIGNQRDVIYMGDYDYSDDVLRENVHLYAVSDDEIKEGDWCYDEDSDKGVVKCLRTAKDSYWNKLCKKIIATTDKSLKIKDFPDLDNSATRGLPTFKQSFLEKYCRVGGIDEVMVEYEQWTELLKYNGINYVHNQWTKKIPLNSVCGEFEYRLKVNKDKTINTFSVNKKLYTREEIESILFKYAEEEHAWFSSKSETDSFNNWIKENL